MSNVNKVLSWAPISLALILFFGAWLGTAHAAPLGPLAFVPQPSKFGEAVLCVDRSSARHIAHNSLAGMSNEDALKAVNKGKKRPVCEPIGFTAVDLQPVEVVSMGERELDVTRFLLIEIHPAQNGSLHLRLNEDSPYLYGIIIPSPDDN